MGLFSWIKKHAEDIVDPIGSAVGDNKYVNAGRALVSGGVAGLSDMGTRRIVEGIKENGLRGAVGGLSDAATWGAGDVIQPLYTDEQGDNPFYDRIGPIMAGYWGGPFAGALADYWTKGSKYSEVGDLNLGSMAGMFGSGYGGNNLLSKITGSSSGGSSMASNISTGASEVSGASGGSSMGWTDWIPLIASAASTAGQIYSGDKAADATADASKASSDAILEMYYQSRADRAPWTVAGTMAIGELTDKILSGEWLPEFNPETEPGYQFGYKEFVEKPTLRNASATGRVRSPATDKALTRYATDYASTKYDDFVNRQLNLLRPLQSLADVGQTAVEGNTSDAMQTGTTLGQNALTAGLARSSAYTNAGDAISGGIDSGVSNYLMQQYINNMKN